MASTTLSERDREEIRNALSRVAYLLDTHEYERLGEVFSDDVVFENPGRLEANGLSALIDAFKAFPTPAVSHHATNVIVEAVDDATAECQTKALTLRSGGVVTAAIYLDTVRKRAGEWRIASRRIRPLEDKTQ